MEAKTDREEIMQLHGKVDVIKNSQDITNENLERLIAAIENLETNRIRDIEKRVAELEKWKSGWIGAMKVATIVGIISGIITAIISAIKFLWK